MMQDSTSREDSGPTQRCMLLILSTEHQRRMARAPLSYGMEGRLSKVSHLRPFRNPCVAYRKRSVAGKIQDAGVKATFIGYGYVDVKK